MYGVVANYVCMSINSATIPQPTCKPLHIGFVLAVFPLKYGFIIVQMTLYVYMCMAVGKLDISYPPSIPEHLPPTLRDFLSKSDNLKHCVTMISLN